MLLQIGEFTSRDVPLFKQSSNGWNNQSNLLYGVSQHKVYLS